MKNNIYLLMIIILLGCSNYPKLVNNHDTAKITQNPSKNASTQDISIRSPAINLKQLCHNLNGNLLFEVESTSHPKQLILANKISEITNGIKTQPHVTVKIQIANFNKSNSISIVGRDNSDIVSDIFAIPEDYSSNKLLSINSTKSATKENFNTFSLKLLRNKPYKIIIDKDAKHGPPQIYKRSYREDAEEILTINHDKYKKISGRILSQFINNKEGVFKVSLTLNKQLVSSIGHTDKNGYFDFEMSSTIGENIAQPYKLIITPTNEFSTIPTFEKTINTLRYDLGKIITTTKKQLHNVNLTITNSDDQALSNIKVDIVGSFTNGFLKRSVWSNDSGNISLQLIEGNYSLAITSFNDEPYASKLDQHLIINDDVQKTIILSKRFSTNIFVKSKSLEPIVGASVTLIKTAQNNENNKKIHLGHNRWPNLKGQTNEHGQICSVQSNKSNCHPLHVDSGHYKIAISPTKGSKTPHYFTSANFPEQKKLNIIIPNECQIDSILKNHLDEPIANAFIRIYQKITNYNSSNYTLVGESYTNNSGSFSIFLAK